MAWEEILTLQNGAIAIGAVILIFAGLAIYTVVLAPKKAKKAALLYADWQEKLGLPALTNNANLNSQAIEKFFKLVWPKKWPEELDVRKDISGLTQATALEFTAAANEIIQPPKSPVQFIYDMDDASNASLRLFSVPKDSRHLHLFNFVQEILTLLRSSAPFAEFAHIELADSVDPTDKAGLPSFILAGSGFPSEDADAGARALELLEGEFGGTWLAEVVANDAILFRRQTEEDLAEEAALPVETNPFKKRLEEKRQAEAEAAELAKAEEKAYEEAWLAAEETRKEEERSKLLAAVESGKVSRFAANPGQFLAAEIEIAVDGSDLLSIDEEVEIFASDGIGLPILFSVYSDELLEEDDPRFQKFNELMLASLQKNLGGIWGAEAAEGSITFRRQI